MGKRNPDISVIMCVYNGERWVTDAINSVLSQREVEFEFIIIDDGSTDGTLEILNSYSDERLIIITEKRKGLTRSLNMALDIAIGEFVARLDADDLCMPGRLLKQKRFLCENPGVVLVGSNAILIDEDNNEIGRHSYPTTHESIVSRLESRSGVFPHSSIFFRKDVVIQEGGYNEYFARSQDLDLYLRLSENHSIAGINEFLVKSRIHMDSLSYMQKGDLQLKMGMMALISYFRRKNGLKDFSRSGEMDWKHFTSQVERWLSKQRFSKRREAKIRFRNFRSLIKTNKFGEAASELLTCFLADPTFFLYRGIGLKVPDSFAEFIQSDDLPEY